MAHSSKNPPPKRKQKSLAVESQKSELTEKQDTPFTLSSDEIEWEIIVVKDWPFIEKPAAIIRNKTAAGLTRKEKKMLKPLYPIAPPAPCDVGIIAKKIVAVAPSSATIGVSSVKIIELNLNRTGLVIVNLSVNNISFGIGVNAILSSGITLTPNGVWEMDEFTFCTDEIYAIASGAGSVVSIQEFV